MKMFLVGLLVGAAVYAGADAMFASERSVSPTPQTAVAARTSGAPVRAITAHVGNRAESRQATATTNAQAGSSPCIPLDDADLHDAIRQLLAEQSRREQASLDAEPRDPLWSASMEQQLREFVARHPLGSRFSVTRIDCRTLYCQVEAEAKRLESGERSEDAANAFTTVMEEAGQQFDMARGSMGNSSDGTMIESHVRFRRFKPGMQCPPGYREEECWNR